MRGPARVALVALAVATAAGTAEAQRMTASAQQRLQASLDARSYRAVALVLDSARMRGIPVAPLVNRALQATLHRTPGPRVHDAVSKLADRLAIAQVALGPASSEAEVAAGANALAVGVSREILMEIRALSPARPVTVPLGMLTQLVAQDVKVARASQMVVALMRNGATPAQLVSLTDAVKHDVDAGIDPGAALDIRTRGVLGTVERAIADEGRMIELPPRSGATGAPKVQRKP